MKDAAYSVAYLTQEIFEWAIMKVKPEGSESSNEQVNAQQEQKLPESIPEMFNEEEEPQAQPDQSEDEVDNLGYYKMMTSAQNQQKETKKGIFFLGMQLDEDCKI